MNLSDDKRRFHRGDTNAGAVLEIGASAQAAPAIPVVGAVGFGPTFDYEDDFVRLTDKGWKAMTDSMAASIVRLECECDELRAEVALLREQARIMANQIDGYRDQLCADKCREKAAADTGWANI
jgi:hypothetical protein